MMPRPARLPGLPAIVAAAALLQGCATGRGTIAELSTQAARWDQAIVRKDRQAIAANMADDFRQIGRDGSVADKAAFLDGLLSPDLEIDPYTIEDFEIRLHGKVALLSGRTRMTGSYRGQPFASHYRYIDVYVRRHGKWRIVSVQITAVAP